MTTLLITHPVFAEHLTDPGHPERPERIEAMWAALDDPAFAALKRMEAPLVDRADLERVHPAGYVDALLAKVPEAGLWNVDADTILSPRSGEAALRAAGAAVAGVDAVMAGKAANVFCAVRPPGHHADSERHGGFCLFNNVAVAAMAALERYGLQRVAIVDFDVHHGNGTQDIVWSREEIFFASTHQSPLYPFTGAATERGANGTVLNLPMRAGTRGEAVRLAYEEAVFPRLVAFRPELILVSAGFDSHIADPVGGMALTESDFAWLGRRLCDIAAACCEGRMVAVLEGGYDLEALADSVAAFVREMMR
jgi:acetoin utilization deacetylase AcuC-like enzyme